MCEKCLEQVKVLVVLSPPRELQSALAPPAGNGKHF
jgi:hypothetical protein